jgi:3-hydroxyisobutyrate dehydrogenase-like beta-hydroxyacid dehydrogenase
MDDATLGFIGLGVMGGPMRRNLRMLERTVALGLGDAYHTAVLEAVKRQELR